MEEQRRIVHVLWSREGSAAWGEDGRGEIMYACMRLASPENGHPLVFLLSLLFGGFDLR